MINNKITLNNSCFDGLVGVKNCDAVYDFYLDDHGLPLSALLDVVDNAHGSAKKMADVFIAQSIDSIVKDIHFKDLQANKILNDIEFGEIDLTTEYTGTKEITYVLDKACRLGQFYLSYMEFHVKTGGSSTVITLLHETNTGSVETEIFNDATTDNSVITATVDDFISDTWSVRVVTDGVMYNYTGGSTCGCTNGTYYTVTNTDSDSFSYGLFNFQIRCNVVKHLCKYKKLMALAIIYKTMARYYFQKYTTTAFNNDVNSTKDDAVGLAVYFDSTYINLVNTERNPNEKFGQYQLELERLNKLIPPPKCKACVTCDTVGWKETINIP